MRTNTDVTIYNRISGTESYQRTALINPSGAKSALWENRKAINTLRSGGNTAVDQAVIYIPFGLKANYKSPKDWQALEDKEGFWTLQNGDIIVKGLVEDVIDPSFKPTTLKAKYDDVLVISSVDTMDFGSLSMQHWKVSAK